MTSNVCRDSQYFRAPYSRLHNAKKQPFILSVTRVGRRQQVTAALNSKHTIAFGNIDVLLRVHSPSSSHTNYRKRLFLRFLADAELRKWSLGHAHGRADE